MLKFLKNLQNSIDIQFNKDIIIKDHAYFKYFDTNYGGPLSFPTEYLFTDSPYTISKTLNDDTIIDVESCDNQTNDFSLPISPVQNFFKNLDVSLLKDHLDEENWENNLIKSTWSPVENEFFSLLYQSLIDYKLSSFNSKNIKCNVYLKKHSENFRYIYANFNWDTCLIKWVHSIFMAYLPISLLIPYIEILNEIALKVPWLIYNILYPNFGDLKEDKLNITINSFIFKNIKSTYDAYSNLLKSSLKPNEITNTYGNNEDIHRQFLKDSPLLMRKRKILVLCVPPLVYPNFVQEDKSSHTDALNASNSTTMNWIYENGDFMERLHFWKVNLLPKEWNLHIFKMKREDPSKQTDHAPGERSPLNYSLTVLRALKSKLKTLRKDHPDAFIILWGWNLGAVLSCYATLECPVDLLLCFGFPYIDMKEQKKVSNTPSTPTTPKINQISNLSCHMPRSDTGSDEDSGLMDGSFLRLDELNSPVLYVIGHVQTDCSSMNLKMVEHLRAQLSVPNAMVVVGQSNDNLMLVDSNFEIRDTSGIPKPPVEFGQDVADYFLSRSMLNVAYKMLLLQNSRHFANLYNPQTNSNETSSTLTYPTGVKRAPIPLKFNMKKGKFPASFMNPKSVVAERYKAGKRLKNIRESKLEKSIAN